MVKKHCENCNDLLSENEIGWCDTCNLPELDYPFNQSPNHNPNLKPAGCIRKRTCQNCNSELTDTDFDYCKICNHPDPDLNYPKKKELSNQKFKVLKKFSFQIKRGTITNYFYFYKDEIKDIKIFGKHKDELLNNFLEEKKIELVKSVKDQNKQNINNTICESRREL